MRCRVAASLRVRFAPNALFVTPDVTNWMTAAGIALIAGGLATLICFRAVLFRPGRRRAGRAERPGRVARPEQAPRVRRGSRRRSRELVEATTVPGPAEVPVVEEDDRIGGLASIGLADHEDFELEEDVFAEDEPAVFAEPGPVAEVEEIAVLAEQADLPVEADELELIDELDAIEELEDITPAAEEPPGPTRYGHRVDGWVRPEYRDFPDEPPAGEYWTPIPVDLVRDHEPSAKGYGWPLPVERLPAVPSYEPATGFDLEPVRSEPTEAISPWPRRSEDRRVRLPRSWHTRNETQPFAAVRDEQAPPPRRRPRPRPRPEPPADRNTTVYVSRHAAEPPR